MRMKIMILSILLISCNKIDYKFNEKTYVNDIKDIKNDDPEDAYLIDRFVIKNIVYNKDSILCKMTYQEIRDTSKSEINKEYLSSNKYD